MAREDHVRGELAEEEFADEAGEGLADCYDMVVGGDVQQQMEGKP